MDHLILFEDVKAHLEEEIIQGPLRDVWDSAKARYQFNRPTLARKLREVAAALEAMAVEYED